MLFALSLFAAALSPACSNDSGGSDTPSDCTHCGGESGGSAGNSTDSGGGAPDRKGAGGTTSNAGAPTATSGAGGASNGGASSGTGGASSGGAAASDGGAATGAGGMPAPEFMLVVDTPKDGSTISGSVKVSGWARGFANVEVWDAMHQKPPLGQTMPATDGAFTVTVDTKNLQTGATTWTVWAWDSPPGTPSMRDDSVALMLTLGGATGGTGGASGAGGSTGNGGTSGAGGTMGSGGMAGNGGGRNFILGFYTDNKTDGPYHTWLGYYPEVNYGGSYQVHQPGGGFYLPSVKYPTVLDADISSNGAHMSYDAVASGQLDSQLNATINSIPSAWYPYIYAVRIDSEFNLENDYTSASASTYVKAADHLIALYKAKLPARVKYIWNPNGINGGDLGALVPTTCDVIGVDAYANPTYKNTSAVLFGDKNNPSPGTIWWWTKIAKQKGKPIALPEWGDDYADGVYIRDVAAWAADPANNVVYLGYWDSTDNENASLRGASLTAFTQGFANESYTGSFFAPLLPTSTMLSGF